jgi:hypothetical protein
MPFYNDGIMRTPINAVSLNSRSNAGYPIDCVVLDALSARIQNRPAHSIRWQSSRTEEVMCFMLMPCNPTVQQAFAAISRLLFLLGLPTREAREAQLRLLHDREDR